MTPSVEMVVGTFSTVDVTTITGVEPDFPSDQPAYIQPFFERISDALPGNLRPDLERVSPTEMRLVIKGKPEADEIGLYSVLMPVEGYPQGLGLIPKPARVSLKIGASTDAEPGYRALLYNIPDQDMISFPREYPEMLVSVAHHGYDPEPEPYTGDVICRLAPAGSSNPVFEAPCEQDEPFPWPEEKQDMTNWVASVWLDSDEQPVVTTPYEVFVNTRHLHSDLSIEPGATGDKWSTLELELRDYKIYTSFGWVEPPFSSPPNVYEVSCRYDDETDFSPCIDSGRQPVPRTPGQHRVEVRIKAPDEHVVEENLSWNIEPDHEMDEDDDGNEGTKGGGSDYGSTADDKPPAAKGAKRLPLTLAQRHLVTGVRYAVKASGLAPGERYELRLAGNTVARGRATDDGSASASFEVSRDLGRGRANLVVRGASPTRCGYRRVVVVPAQAQLVVKRWLRLPRTGRKQVFAVRGLAPGEALVARIGKRRITPADARANGHGVYRGIFNVGREPGRKLVRVRGLTPTRRGSIAYRVRGR